MKRDRVRALVATACALVLAATAAACSGESDGESSGIVRVSAAASLTRTFTLIRDDFTAAHPEIDVVLNFAGSATLAAQIDQGAPVDVFASADEATMDAVVDAGLASESRTFARNQLVIAVPEGNPDGIASLADIADAELKVAVCAEQVPCGAAARTALDRAGVELTPATYETDVQATLAKLAMGEVDAALVYRSDVHTAGGAVDAVEFPESAAAVNDYHAAVLTEAQNPAGAELFVEYLLSQAALDVLVAERFQAP